MTTETGTLLAEYAKNGSEPAFRELVDRYLGLVHATAARLLGEDQRLAQDVAQTVFIDLARLAPALRAETTLGGWLHRHTCFVAAKALRAERRRQNRERLAMELQTQDNNASLATIAPVIDDAINRLGADDRAAIMLRFFERQDLRSVAQTLGTSEDAAQKRVSRALDKLRQRLAKEGFGYSVGVLAVILAADTLTAAPAGLATGCAASALAGASGGGITLILLKLMNLTPLKTAIASLVAAAAVATPVVLQQNHTIASLREDNQTLRQQAAQIDELKAQSDAMAQQLAEARTQKLADTQMTELIQLRGEVGRLRTQTKETEKLRAQLSQVRAARAEEHQAATQERQTASQASLANACINNLRQIDAAKQQWALEYKKTTNDIPREEDIRPYIGPGPGMLPTCPAGGVYTIGNLVEQPRCSIPGHTLTATSYYYVSPDGQ